jgi:hypothetical protein
MTKQTIKTTKEIDNSINLLSKKVMKDYPDGSIDLVSLNHTPKFITLDLEDSNFRSL